MSEPFNFIKTGNAKLIRHNIQRHLITNRYPRWRHSTWTNVVPELMRRVIRFTLRCHAFIVTGPDLWNIYGARTGIHYPPTQMGTIIKKSDSSSYKKTEKNQNFRIKSKSIISHFGNDNMVGSIQKTVVKRSKSSDDSSLMHQFKLKGEYSTAYITKSNSIISRIG